MATNRRDIFLAEVENGDDIDNGVYLMIRVPEHAIRSDPTEFIVDANYITSILNNNIESDLNVMDDDENRNLEPISTGSQEDDSSSSVHTSPSCDVQHSTTMEHSSSDDDIDFQGITYRTFINVLRKWSSSDDVTFYDMRNYLSSKDIHISKTSLKRLLYRALVKKTIIRTGVRRNKKYKIIKKREYLEAKQSTKK